MKQQKRSLNIYIYIKYVKNFKNREVDEQEGKKKNVYLGFVGTTALETQIQSKHYNCVQLGQKIGEVYTGKKPILHKCSYKTVLHKCFVWN